VGSAARELLAPVADVWGFLAEPYHLSDWWPGVTGVEPDTRGFAQGARWKVTVVDGGASRGGGFFNLPPMGTPGGPRVPQILEITSLVPPERWSFRLVREKSDRPTDVTVRLAACGSDRTLATIEIDVPRSGLFSRSSQSERLAERAVDRLYDLVQTAATL
jgi:uncharacterized protein YndB with AHSA1/START domain